MKNSQAPNGQSPKQDKILLKKLDELLERQVFNPCDSEDCENGHCKYFVKGEDLPAGNPGNYCVEPELMDEILDLFEQRGYRHVRG